MHTLGARAKAARDHLSLKRSDVTTRCGWTRAATIHEIERDAYDTLRTDTAAELARALEVDLAWLITGDAAHAPSWLGRSLADDLAEPDTTVEPKPRSAA